MVGRLVYNYNSAYQAKRINELLWFASMVKPNAEWDIKVEERWEAILEMEVSMEISSDSF